MYHVSHRTLPLLLALLMMLAAAPIAMAQYGDGHIRKGDTLKLNRPQIDSTFTDSSATTSDTLDPDQAFFQQIDSTTEDVELPEPRTFFKTRGGILFGTLVVNFLKLDLAKLDPTLDGTPVTYGVEAYTLLNSWLIGGSGVSTTVYGMSSNYDRFSYGYGGALLGYDTKIFYGAASLQGSLLVGAGGLEMIKKRTDLRTPGGPEILERYREESFFCLRPGVSLSFAPVQYIHISAGVNYLIPFGGSSVDDLRAVSYGIGLTLGLGD